MNFGPFKVDQTALASTCHKNGPWAKKECENTESLEAEVLMHVSERHRDRGRESTSNKTGLTLLFQLVEHK